MNKDPRKKLSLAVAALGLLLASAVQAAQPLRVVTTLNSIYDNQDAVAGKSRSYTRWSLYIGSADASELVLSANGWALPLGSVTNSYTIVSMAIEKDGTSLHVPVTWSGSRSKTINPGDNDIQSDPVPASAFGQTSFARGGKYWVRTLLSVPVAGNAIPMSSARAASANPDSQAVWFDPAVTTILNGVDATGKFTTTGTKPETRASGFFPIVLGRFVTGDPVTMIAIGDSITAGFGDSKSPVHGFGMYQRALVDADGSSNPIAGLNWARGGAATGNYLNPTITSWAKYANHAYVNLGTNDLGAAGGGSVDALTDNLQRIWNALKGHGVQKIIHGTLEPRTSSTDAFASVAGQSPLNAAWAAGGKSEELNLWLQSQKGLQLFDVLPFANNRAPGDAYRWAANGTVRYTTTDGVHPSPQGHIFAANEIRAAIAQLAAPAVTVSLTAPTAGATVSGASVLISAAGTGQSGQALAGVQFQLDGVNLLPEDTTSPYSVVWNTTTSGNGPHVLRAVARDGAGNTGTSADIAVTVANATPAPEIQVLGNGLLIADGSTAPSVSNGTDFGGVAVTGGAATKIYTIQNSGTASLNVGNLTLSGSNASEFSVLSQPSATVAAGGTTTFTLRFDPGASGLRSASVSFANSDGDENPTNFSIQGTGTIGSGLPSPWLNQDVGSVGQTGSATYSGSVFTVTGCGVDFSPRTADAFHYAYQAASGSSWTLTARVASLTNAPDAIKGEGGVMIRETLAVNSPYAQMGITSGRGLRFQYRTATGATSVDTAGGSGVAPYWVRIVRSGNTFTGYKSTDGSTWNLVGSASITMGNSVYLGLAVCHHGGLGTATFDSVSLAP